MNDPTTRQRQCPLVPHPDDEAEVRAGLEEAERGVVLSAEESAAHVRALVDDEPVEK